MELRAGETQTLTVIRIASFGYFLSDEQESQDIMMHKREATKELEIDEQVEVYLYHDHSYRLAATMHKPLLTFGKIAWLEVVGTGKQCLFLYNGISRDLFLSTDNFPLEETRWPIVGDRLPVSMTYDKKGRVMAQLVKGEPIEQRSEKADKSVVNKDIEGTAYHFVSEGVFIYTEEKYLAFLHRHEMEKVPRLGQKITARVTYVRPDGRINVSQKSRKLEGQVEDSKAIFDYLIKRGGEMPMGDKSPVPEIEQRFGISKAAFKRALGKLMKEGKIYQENGWTKIKEGQ